MPYDEYKSKCSHIGCNELISDRRIYCDKHRAEISAKQARRNYCEKHGLPHNDKPITKYERVRITKPKIIKYSDMCAFLGCNCKCDSVTHLCNSHMKMFSNIVTNISEQYKNFNTVDEYLESVLYNQFGTESIILKERCLAEFDFWKNSKLNSLVSDASRKAEAKAIEKIERANRLISNVVDFNIIEHANKSSLASKDEDDTETTIQEPLITASPEIKVVQPIVHDEHCNHEHVETINYYKATPCKYSGCKHRAIGRGLWCKTHRTKRNNLVANCRKHFADFKSIEDLKRWLSYKNYELFGDTGIIEKDILYYFDNYISEHKPSTYKTAEEMCFQKWTWMVIDIIHSALNIASIRRKSFAVIEKKNETLQPYYEAAYEELKRLGYKITSQADGSHIVSF